MNAQQEPYGAPPPPTDSPQASNHSRGRLALIIGAIVVTLTIGATTATVLVLNHRSDVAAQERRAAAERKAEAERQTAEEREAQELAAVRERYSACTAELGPLLKALGTVDARLDVGLSQKELSALVGRASVLYNRIDIDELGTGKCLSAGARLENALNLYTITVQVWNDCIYDVSCDVDNDVLPGMQTKWRRAAQRIGRGESMLESLDPDSANFDAGTSA